MAKTKTSEKTKKTAPAKKDSPKKGNPKMGAKEIIKYLKTTDESDVSFDNNVLRIIFGLDKWPDSVKNRYIEKYKVVVDTLGNFDYLYYNEMREPTKNIYEMFIYFKEHDVHVCVIHIYDKKTEETNREFSEAKRAGNKMVRIK